MCDQIHEKRKILSWITDIVKIFWKTISIKALSETLLAPRYIKNLLLLRINHFCWCQIYRIIIDIVYGRKGEICPIIKLIGLINGHIKCVGLLLKNWVGIETHVFGEVRHLKVIPKCYVWSVSADNHSSIDFIITHKEIGHVSVNGELIVCIITRWVLVKSQK